MGDGKQTTAAAPAAAAAETTEKERIRQQRLEALAKRGL